MNAVPPPIPARPLPSFLRWLALGVLGCALGVALLIVGITGYFRLGGDAGALRDTVLRSGPGAWERKVELNIGALTCGLARTAASFLKLAPEAHAALKAVRAAEVGVYHLAREEALSSNAALLAAANERMASRGWEPLVGVAGEGRLVAVYVPKKLGSPGKVNVCLLTLQGRDLVVVSARGNLDPLLELALNSPEWKKQQQAWLRL